MEMQLTPVTNRPVFFNKNLEKVTQTILKAGANIQSNRYGIAALLAKVQTEGLYKDDGFQHASEYACQTFGIEKSLAYDLIKMGQQYTRPVLNEKGKTVGYCSNLLPAANPDTCDAPALDFTPTQIGRFMSLGREKVVDLVRDGKLSPRMTIREINAVVKENKPKKDIETSFTDNDEQPVEATEQPVEATEQPEPTIVNEPRTAGFDNIPTDFIIAELRLRGFKVYNADDVEMVFDWKQ